MCTVYHVHMASQREPLADRPPLSVRLPESAWSRLEALMAARQREQSDMARRVIEAGLTVLEATAGQS